MMIEELIAGDTLDFLDTVDEYPPADGWTLKYRLVPRFTTPLQAPIVIEATTSGTDYRVQAAASITAAWQPGTYDWARWVEQAGPIRQSLGSGQLEVKPDPAAATQGSLDNRSHARKVLEAIEAVIQSRATKDQEEYSIHGRSLKRTPIEELLKLKDHYAAIVAREVANAAIEAGNPNPRNVGMRLTRI